MRQLYNQTKEENEKLKDQNNELQVKIKSQLAEIEKMKVINEKYSSELSSRQNKSPKLDLSQKSKEDASSCEELKKMAEQIQQEKQTLKTLQSQIYKLDLDKQELVQKNQELAGKFNSQQQNSGNLKEDGSNKNSETKYGGQSNNQNQCEQNINSQQKQFETRIEGMQNQINDREKYINELKMEHMNQISNLKQEYEQKQAALMEKIALLQEAQIQRNVQITKNQNNTQKLDEAEQIQQLRNQIDKKEEEILKKQDFCQEQKMNYEIKIQRFIEELDQKSSNLDKLQKEQTDMKVGYEKEISEQRLNLESSAKIIQQLELKQHQDNLQKANDLTKTTDQQNQVEEKELVKKLQVEEVEGQSTILKLNYHEQELENQKIQNQLTQRELQLQQLKTVYDQLEEEKNNLNKNFEQLQESLRNEVNKSKNLETKLVVIESENNSLISLQQVIKDQAANQLKEEIANYKLIEGQLAEKDKLISELRNNSVPESQNNVFANLKDEIKSLQEENKNLQEEVLDQSRIISEKMNFLDQERKISKKLTMKVDEFSQQPIGELKQQLEDLSWQAEQVGCQNEQLQNMIEQSEHQIQYYKQYEIEANSMMLMLQEKVKELEQQLQDQSKQQPQSQGHTEPILTKEEVGSEKSSSENSELTHLEQQLEEKDLAIQERDRLIAQRDDYIQQLAAEYQKLEQKNKSVDKSKTPSKHQVGTNELFWDLEIICENSSLLSLVNQGWKFLFRNQQGASEYVKQYSCFSFSTFLLQNFMHNIYNEKQQQDGIFQSFNSNDVCYMKSIHLSSFLGSKIPKKLAKQSFLVFGKLIQLQLAAPLQQVEKFHDEKLALEEFWIYYSLLQDGKVIFLCNCLEQREIQAIHRFCSLKKDANLIVIFYSDKPPSESENVGIKSLFSDLGFVRGEIADKTAVSKHNRIWVEMSTTIDKQNEVENWMSKEILHDLNKVKSPMSLIDQLREYMSSTSSHFFEDGSKSDFKIDMAESGEYCQLTLIFEDEKTAKKQKLNDQRTTQFINSHQNGLGWIKLSEGKAKIRIQATDKILSIEKKTTIIKDSGTLLKLFLETQNKNVIEYQVHLPHIYLKTQLKEEIKENIVKLSANY